MNDLSGKGFATNAANAAAPYLTNIVGNGLSYGVNMAAIPVQGGYMNVSTFFENFCSALLSGVWSNVPGMVPSYENGTAFPDAVLISVQVVGDKIDSILIVTWGTSPEAMFKRDADY